ncbi:MAG: TIGR01777 family oxidoreductase [bacterium]
MARDSSIPSVPATVAITGATGMVGSALVARLLERGHKVRRLVRSGRNSQPGDMPWDPDGTQLDARVLAGCDAIVHLAGAPIAQRWTSAHKREIRESRVRGTSLIANAVAAMAVKPMVVLSGSAIGYYGDRGDEQLDEQSDSGTDFLARVSREWEGATAPISNAGVRVVLLRTGIVLSPRGGALGKMLLPFQLGLGGRMGSGRQWMSWISLEDHVRAMEHTLFTAALHGPVNLVGPEPVTNATFAATLGRVLSRPAVLPVPQIALRLAFGEMAESTILASQRVSPRALLASDFRFCHATLEAALRGTQEDRRIGG